MQFREGDKVVVVDGGDFPGSKGMRGTVVDDGSKSGGLIAVKPDGRGFKARITSAVLGYPGYYAEQLRRA